jgi:hypothetical protein
MDIAITAAGFGLAALAILFFLARRLMRLAVRLVLAFILVIILVAGGLFWWWSGSDSSSQQNANRSSTPARRNTNAR